MTNRNVNHPDYEAAVLAVKSRFDAIPGIVTELFWFEIQAGPRVVAPKRIPQIIATVPGTDSVPYPERVLVSAHMDTVLLADRHRGIAPGANDDGSGVFAVLHAAEVAAQRPARRDRSFVVFSAEEQGLLGAVALAAHAQSEGWRILAMLNHDMIGNVSRPDGATIRDRFRLYSADGAAREVARHIAWIARDRDVRAELHLRPDRPGRGGDHTPFANVGYPAVRFIEAQENYDRQHTPADLPEGIDFDYLAAIANLTADLTTRYASTGAIPTDVVATRHEGYHTRLVWTGGEAPFRVYVRDTASAYWQQTFEAHSFEVRLPLTVDNHEFAVASGDGIPVPAVIR